MNGEICTEAFDDLGVVFGKFLTRLEARGQMVPKGNFDDLFIQTSRVVFCYMISFILLLVTLLYRKA